MMRTTMIGPFACGSCIRRNKRDAVALHKAAPPTPVIHVSEDGREEEGSGSKRFVICRRWIFSTKVKRMYLQAGGNSLTNDIYISLSTTTIKPIFIILSLSALLSASRRHPIA
jgi:hypothetical protein